MVSDWLLEDMLSTAVLCMQAGGIEEALNLIHSINKMLKEDGRVVSN